MPSDTPEGTVIEGTESTIPVEIEIITIVPDGDDYAGWQKRESNTSSFWLPIDYWGLYMQEGNQAWYKTYRRGFLNPYPKILPLLDSTDKPTPTPEPGSEPVDLSEIDFGVAVDDDQINSIVLISEPVPEETSLGVEFTRIENELGQGYRVMERQIIEDTQIPTGRMVFKFREDPIQPSGMQIMYFFLQDGRLWTLSFNTPIDMYDDTLQMSEKSVGSFEILP